MIWDSLWTIVKAIIIDPLLSLPLPEVPFDFGPSGAFSQWIAVANKFVDVSLLFKYLGAIAGIAVVIFLIRLIMLLWGMIRG